MMDLDIVILSEVSQMAYDIASMWNLINGTKELIHKTEIEFSSIQFSLSAVSSSLWLQGL